MTKKQENKLRMYLAVKAFFDSNSELLDPLPSYPKFLAAFVIAVNYLEKASEEALIDTSGRKDKLKALKLELSEDAIDLSRRLKAYATFTKDYNLIKEVSYSLSQLKRMRITRLKEVVAGLLSRAQEQLEYLASYGVTVESLAALTTLLENYKKNIPNTRMATADGIKYRQQIKKSIKEADKAIKNIDLAIEIIRKSDHDNYTKYKTLRKSLDYGKGSMALKAKIVDSRFKQPLKNVKVEFKLKANGKELLPENYQAIIKKTADKGGFYIKSMPEGIYEVEVSKNGYQSKQLSVAITNGELYKLEMELTEN